MAPNLRLCGLHGGSSVVVARWSSSVQHYVGKRDVVNERVLPQNGEAKVVVMDVDTYDRWRDAMTLLNLLAQAEGDVTADRTVSQRGLPGAHTAIERVRRGGWSLRPQASWRSCRSWLAVCG